VGIPGLTGQTGDLNSYINALYRMSISIAALLAVIKIIAAGAKYMLSDIVTHKEDAKNDIQGALVGLLVVIGAVLILNTINPDLAKVNFNVDSVEVDDEINNGSNDILTAVSSGTCDADSGCKTMICTDGVNTLNGLSQYLPTDVPKTCSAQCTAAGGLYYTHGKSDNVQGVAFTRCAISTAKLEELINSYNNSLITSKCPEGESCYVESCSVYGTEYYLLAFKTCNNICTGKFNGLYDEPSDSCVLNGVSESVSKTIPCTGTVDTVSFIGSGVKEVDNRCNPEYDKCFSEGGYLVSSNGTSLTCRTPVKKVWTCPEGEVLKYGNICEPVINTNNPVQPIQ
jgi:hypothetical protein